MKFIKISNYFSQRLILLQYLFLQKTTAFVSIPAAESQVIVELTCLLSVDFDNTEMKFPSSEFYFKIKKWLFQFKTSQ